MKHSILILSLVAAASLSACVVAPVPGGRVAVHPQVEIVYHWDPIVLRYYHVDRGHKRYMPQGWRHPKHPHYPYIDGRDRRDHRDYRDRNRRDDRDHRDRRGRDRRD